MSRMTLIRKNSFSTELFYYFVVRLIYLMRFYGLQLLMLLVAAESSYGQTITPAKEDTIQPVLSLAHPNGQYKVNPGPILAAAIMIGYGAATFHVRPLHELDLSTKHEIREDNSRFHTTIDNYLQYSPIFGVYALNAMGIHGAHNFKERTIILGMSSLLVCGTVTGLKTLTHRERPDGSAANSFPSGHTATAFMSAEFMRMEYKDVSPWIVVGGYMAATATGVLRMYNNRHWLSDVVAGAGVGILSTQAAYWLYPKIEKGLSGKANTSTMVMPTYDAGTKSAAISLVYIH
ncbi:phosphatase PAP2 family protein [Chitinophaga sp. LS1]|uniref:phosphatase PAP2 family protein n=1 Tax=Chitinophaga sp. LS1 TaxID=3051176 RepID=UPI002AAACAC9|nr:phosphatase PAP2 family protein [Chitinophaga sp. LS1]WPV64767.1 phosphatase PAP2 family protein [Chitinophaga sp. LS1]